MKNLFFIVTMKNLLKTIKSIFRNNMTKDDYEAVIRAIFNINKARDLLKELSKPESIRDTMEYLALKESFRWMEETSYYFLLHIKKHYADFEDYFKFSIIDNNWTVIKGFKKIKNYEKRAGK